jgi:uncharacterized protein involved in response to NO
MSRWRHIRTAQRAGGEGVRGHLPLQGELAEPAVRPRFALAAKGFRPFFLLAAAFGALIVPVWLLITQGALAPAGYLEPTSWHAHEMIYGYTVAVIAGFLLTAVGNWTQRETLVGTPLLALAGFWLLGRVAMSSAPVLPWGTAALLDLTFLPLLAVAIARPLFARRDRRNLVMLGVLAALFAANVVVHLAALGMLAPGAARRACLSAVDVIVFLMLLIAGRVLPVFTRNATSVASITSSVWLERSTALAAVALVLVDLVWPDTRGAAATAGLLAIITVARAARWGALHTLRTPLLWILHLGYLWLVVGLVLRALPALGVPVWSSLATHALTVGAIGALTLGMMARVALGHTGRPLVASPAMTCAFGCIAGAAALRVIVPLVAPQWHAPALLAAGSVWTLAFLIYLVIYLPILTTPRVDGKAG